MSSLPHDHVVYVPKNKPKKDIKFNVSLNEEQKRAKNVILNNPVTVLKGHAGSGKTLVAAQTGLDLLFMKEVSKIIITRPTVAKEEIGFLPGDIREKMDPWLAPIYHNLFMLYNEAKIRKELDLGNIEIVPLAFIRGRTFVNSFVLIDEAQNLTHNQTEAILGRLGKFSKMVFCGDTSQIDLKDKKQSGFSFLSRVEENVPGFKTFLLKENHRHEIVPPILKVYDEFS